MMVLAKPEGEGQGEGVEVFEDWAETRREGRQARVERRSIKVVSAMLIRGTEEDTWEDMAMGRNGENDQVGREGFIYLVFCTGDYGVDVMLPMENGILGGSKLTERLQRERMWLGPWFALPRSTARGRRTDEILSRADGKSS